MTPSATISRDLICKIAKFNAPTHNWMWHKCVATESGGTVRLTIISSSDTTNHWIKVHLKAPPRLVEKKVKCEWVADQTPQTPNSIDLSTPRDLVARSNSRQTATHTVRLLFRRYRNAHNPPTSDQSKHPLREFRSCLLTLDHKDQNMN